MMFTHISGNSSFHIFRCCVEPCVNLVFLMYSCRAIPRIIRGLVQAITRFSDTVLVKHLKGLAQVIPRLSDIVLIKHLIMGLAQIIIRLSDIVLVKLLIKGLASIITRLSDIVLIKHLLMGLVQVPARLMLRLRDVVPVEVSESHRLTSEIRPTLTVVLYLTRDSLVLEVLVVRVHQVEVLSPPARDELVP